ncbi:hypothetical protein [Streptomyces bathyalis]|uniref:hypothetical protein n=1 Tax=Streptomyces bathyalis TaxID=2710756 RepID=UPI001FE6E260|nr:hypothetical protein [Streptomyces bathyalis]
MGGHGEGRDARSRSRRGSGHIPGPRAVPDLTPVRPAFRGRHRLRRIVRGRRRVTAAGLAVAAAALAVWVPRGERADPAHAHAGRESPPGRAATTSLPDRHPTGGREPGPVVSAPVRIADAASVRLLHPGDRVDVIAGPDGTGRARVVARGARVDRVPRSVETGAVGAADEGALVVLRVPRGTATALAGAGAAGRLAVTLC